MKIDKYYNQNEPNAAKQADEPKSEPQKQSSSINIGIKMDSFVDNKFLLIGLAVLIIAINVVLRAGLLQYQGLFEPDGFFYYSVIRQAISNHFVVSNYLNISGFPMHNFIGEAPGLPYLTVMAYYLFHSITSLSALTIMRWMPIFFGILYAILAYFLARYLSNSKALGLLTMFFVSVSSGNIARTAGTVYRGDSFITLFLLLALLLMLKCFGERKSFRKYLWAVLSAVSLSLGMVVWNGAPFITVVYMLGLMFIILYGFIKADNDILFSGVVLSITLLIMHFLQLLYVSLGIARAGLQLTSNTEFFIFYTPILIGSVAAYYIIRNIQQFSIVSTQKRRAFATAGAVLVVFVILVAVFSNTLLGLASPVSPIITPTVTSNSATVGAAITQTTQELQKPSYSFLWSSFSVQLYLSIIGVLLFLLFSFLVSKGLIKDDNLRLNNVAFLAIFAYFVVTGYLQYSAIRFNAIISLPLAVFSAFAIYSIGKLVYNRNINSKTVAALVTVITALIMIALVYYYYFYPSPQTSIFSALNRFTFIAASIILISVLLVAAFVYSIYGTAKGNISVMYIVVALVLVILIFNMFNTYLESYTAAQADGINPQFLEAMAWLRNNTSPNATVLALWPDGSVVEGWGNRTSYMDSVGGERSARIYNFSNFLFNTSLDTQYLYGIGKPQYFIARNFWYAELGGIAQEGLVQNASAYGYVALSSFNSTSNGTATFFTFGESTPPYYVTELITIPSANSTQPPTYKAYLGIRNGTRLTMMRSIIFMNTSNSQYSISNIGSANDSVNYSLLISFSGHQINGAYILGPNLVQSNIFKFTFLCNAFTCPYNSSSASMSQVYANGDTRIFRINYR
ncbi:MAG: phospholipid carrier-dependent glycosyltransferase [Candidatus Micrarchaeota archaeon]|nr:phospholipid carrier-dependent glycosyltransferase [Candidatus Micrarchaeota archaeon]